MMKNILLAVLLLTGLNALCGDRISGTIKANLLNVRVKAGEKYAVVAQLGRNDKVTVLGFEKGWYEIVAPAKSSVWISSAFVADGIVTQRTFIRTGPSVACPPYAKSAEQGLKVQVLDKSQEGWFRIAVFEGLSAWVNADYVEVEPVLPGMLKDGGQEPAPQKGAEGNPGEPRGGKSGASSEQGAKLPYTGMEPKPVSYEGVLLPLRHGDDAAYVTHALGAKADGQLFPICYVFSRKMNMKLWEDRRIQVTGSERWVRGWRKPVVEADIVNALW